MTEELTTAKLIQMAYLYDATVHESVREQGQIALREMMEAFEKEWDDREKRLTPTPDWYEQIYNL